MSRIPVQFSANPVVRLHLFSAGRPAWCPALLSIDMPLGAPVSNVLLRLLLHSRHVFERWRRFLIAGTPYDRERHGDDDEGGMALDSHCLAGPPLWRMLKGDLADSPRAQSLIPVSNSPLLSTGAVASSDAGVAQAQAATLARKSEVEIGQRLAQRGF